MPIHLCNQSSTHACSYWYLPFMNQQCCFNKSRKFSYCHPNLFFSKVLWSPLFGLHLVNYHRFISFCCSIHLDGTCLLLKFDFLRKFKNVSMVAKPFLLQQFSFFWNFLMCMQEKYFLFHWMFSLNSSNRKNWMNYLY